MTLAETRAITATKLSMSMPPYPMKRASLSRSMSFGVVPEEIRAWKPETAPQAMVMNRNGNSDPAQTGPLPSTNLVTAGICMCGAT
jgi:hypothetical protein